MLNLLEFNPANFFGFFLILIRLSGIFLTAPILSMETIPRMVRVYMVLLVSFILYSFLPTRPVVANFAPGAYLLIVVKELMVGLLLGAIPRLMFAAVDFAGTIIGFQMGLSMASVVDPSTQSSVSLIASIETLIATMLFVVLDGHHIFFEVLVSSYEHIPVAGFNFMDDDKVDFLIRVTGDVFIIGMKLGAPIIVALFLTNAILGLMARSMPSLNIFVVGFPLTILLGIVFLIIGMPYFTKAVSNVFLQAAEQIQLLIQTMAK